MNKQRLINNFMEFVKIKSLSKQELNFALYVKEYAEKLGFKTFFDNSKEKIENSNCSNLICILEGDKEKEPIFLSAHLDTVYHDGNIEPIIENDKIVSKGETILGSDDKAGIAIIFEAVESLIEDKINIPTIELIFTVCEEIGLFGAKYLDYNKINSKKGIVLDTGGDVGVVVNSAPYNYNFKIEVIGKEAHAGMCPENGINSIFVMSKAISKLHLGRFDEVTTCNIGQISGGTAVNIVPYKTKIEGEVRSHKEENCFNILDKIYKTFDETTKEYNAKFNFIKDLEFSGYKHDETDPFFNKLISTINKLGYKLVLKKAGGGADTNVFNLNNLKTVVIGIGMENAHTKDEYIKIENLEKGTNLIYNFIKNF
jgi:tripeptide aminopeptidase